MTVTEPIDAKAARLVPTPVLIRRILYPAPHRATARTRALAVVFLCASALLGAQSTYTSAEVGYSITLPDTWRRLVRDDSTHSFYDSSAVRGSQIYITRHHRDATVFPTAESWIRAHFVAYKIAVDYSGFPYSGVVLYFDSTASRKLGDLWAPELYATYLLADTLNPANPPVAAWSDFTKVTAAGNFGYEVYAVGDTADMMANAGYYDSLMLTVRITPPSSSVRRAGVARITGIRAHGAYTSSMRVDMLGRQVRSSHTHVSMVPLVESAAVTVRRR
jgi:hypothetical protein